MAETIYLGKATAPGTIFLNNAPMTHREILAERARKQRIADVSLKVAGLAATAGLLALPGGVLLKGAKYALPVAGKVATRLMPKTVKGIAGTILGAGVLASSSRARDFVKQAPKRIFTSGKRLGDIIDDPSKAKNILGISEGMTTKEKVIAAGKRAGLYGAAIGGALAVGGLVKKKLAERKAEKLISSTKALGFTDPQPVGLGGVPIIQAHPVAVGAPGQPLTAPPVQNIIQIQVH